jgi:hypothetical protein
LSRHPLNRASRIGLLLFVALMCSPVSAQMSLLTTYKTAADAEQYRKAIATIVGNQMAKLTSDDPAASRKWFGDQVAQNQNPSPSFLNVYGDIVNDAVKKVLGTQPPPSLGVRLNLAIINANVAARANNATQAAATADLLNDPSAAVVLWGMKAAKYELAPWLAQPKALRKGNLTKAILDAVRAHPDSGPIAEEAYSALTFEATDPTLRSTAPAVIQEATVAVLQMAALRTSLFNADPPPELFADGRGVVFLARTKVWGLNNAAQQKQVMDTLYKFLESTGKVIPNPGTNDVGPMVDFVRQIGRAIYSISPELKPAADQIAGIGSETKADDIDTRLKAIRATIDKVFPGH